MAVEKLNIETFLELSRSHLVIDVRSPAEFNHAHIPEAYNLPLFSDEERKVVGTKYKQESRENAIKTGLDFFGPKMKNMIEEIETIHSLKMGRDRITSLPSRALFIYCWRGGMRSAGVAWLMDLYGFKVYVLAGGYKRFRNCVLQTFRFPFQFSIVGGFTGSGKTEMLKSLKNQGEIVVDLEQLARHRGSAFGKITTEKQPTQEMFENILALHLREAQGRWHRKEKDPDPSASSVIWLEDESQRIGDLNIPHELWKTMRLSPLYFLDIPFEKRLNYIVKEYGGMEKEKLVGSIIRIQKRLGGLETKNALHFLREDNTTECFRILLKYYDKWYLKSLHNRENVNSLLVNIPCENVGAENAKALRQQAIIS